MKMNNCGLVWRGGCSQSLVLGWTTRVFNDETLAIYQPYSLSQKLTISNGLLKITYRLITSENVEALMKKKKIIIIISYLVA